MRAASSLRSAANVIVGPILWATHFLAIYVSESLLCRAGLPGWHDVLVAGTTFVVLLALAWHGAIFLRCRWMDGTQGELAGIAIGLNAVSALAVCFAAFASALPACLSD